MSQFETHDIEYIAQNSTEKVSYFPFVGAGQVHIKAVLGVGGVWVYHFLVEMFVYLEIETSI